jgi:hypothetical protein
VNANQWRPSLKKVDGVLQDSPRRGEPPWYLISSTNRTSAYSALVESPFFEFHTMAHNRITTHTHARAPILLMMFLCCTVDLDDRTAGQTPTHGGSGCDSLRWPGWLLHAGLESALTAWDGILPAVDIVCMGGAGEWADFDSFMGA